MSIEKVAVIGAGLMGSGIAAQVANAGYEAVLLDIVPEGCEDRSQLAKGAIEKLKKGDPPPLMNKGFAKRITPGNTQDDMYLIADCDWVIEVVLEDAAIKQTTYANIEQHRRPGTIVSSNTSTIPLNKLVEGRSEDFRQHFLITHFFNPPRFMRLLELVRSGETTDETVATIRDFCDRALGKGVVECNDTPAFIVNRLLIYWLQTGLNQLIAHDVSIETADAVMGKPVGVPKTGIFGLIDLVGVDLMPHLADSLQASLPKSDDYHAIAHDYPFVHQMIEAGYTGRKGEGGFYRLKKTESGKIKQALRIDPDSFDPGIQYTASVKPKLASADAGKHGIRAVIETDDEGGRYARAVLLRTLSYAAKLVGEVADNIFAIDEAFKLGANWKLGPFEMMDNIGPEWLAGALEAEGLDVPQFLRDVGDGTFYKVEGGRKYYFGTDGKYHTAERPDGVIRLEDIKLATEPVYKTSSAALWDVGDGVLCLEFTAKMNALDEQVFDVIHKAIKTIGDGTGDYKGLVVYNEGSHFSAGANLGMAMFAINVALWPQIEQLVSGGQKAYSALKYAPFPVVAAPSGMALGGGCEILLHADHIAAHAETYCGLVEAGVGLVPAWGGCKEFLLRWREREAEEVRRNTGSQPFWFSPEDSPMRAPRTAFETIGVGTVAKSAVEARQIGFLREDDTIVMNRDRLLYQARDKVKELAKDYQPPEKPKAIRLPGPSGKMAMDLAVGDMHKAGTATDYDCVVADALAYVLSGGENADYPKHPLSEDDLLKLEREQFMQLVKKDGTMARIEYMLENNKPLRN